MQSRVRELLADSRTDVWMCDPESYKRLGRIHLLNMHVSNILNNNLHIM